MFKFHGTCYVLSMHFHTDSTGLLSSSFGQGTGPIFLDNVACVGTENSLEDCTHDPSAADCTHHEDAAVRCNPHGKRESCLMN